MFAPPPPTRPAGVSILSGVMALWFLTPLLRMAHLYLRLILNSILYQPHVFDFYLLYFAGMILLEPAIIFFFWRGHEWARWVVLIAAMYTLLSAAFQFVQPIHAVHPPFFFLIAIAESLAAAFLLYYLNTRTIRAWFR